ncbi:aminoglycoside phosphotransferase family protein [Sphaerisporangium flaviroseum]|uniref:phosphotransferase family protein n=1 Tax=Sphaerisporangium flaviroseum TaxID=509199 RepID=UPI0031ED3C0E
MTANLTGGLARLARAHDGAGPVTVLKDTRVTVVRAGDVVVKAHPPGTDEAALTARLRTAARLPGVLLAPLAEWIEQVEGRLVTVWPAGEPVDPDDPDGAPWEAAAGLLARLHAVPVDGLGLPPAGGPARLARAVAQLDGLSTTAAEVIREAFRSLPPEAADTGPGAGRLTHGDWHLGQLVRHQGEWLLIDVDDLGAGTPAWDLARPGAWFATGFLAPDLWLRFLTAYLLAGGTAVPQGDPWRELDVPARALTVQLAATAVAAARTEDRPLDDVEEALVSSCGRIISTALPQ